MDLSLLKDANGFVTRLDLFNRMVAFHWLANDDYCLFCQVPGTYFSVIGVQSGTGWFHPFKIYTGNSDLYNYIRDLFHDVAKQLNFNAESEDWRADANG